MPQSSTDSIRNHYIQRPMQREVHSSLKRFSVLNIHRRAGKTILAINELIKQIFTCPHKKPRCAYIAPFRSQAKTIAWDYLQEYTLCIPGMAYNQSELRADFPNGGRITLYGADNPNSLRGLYLDYVVLDEVAQIAPSLWTKVIRPTLSDRIGGALFIGTPFGMSNMFYEMYENAHNKADWYRSTFTAEQTDIIPKEELIAAKESMSIEEYNQEFNCSWSSAIRGAFYAKEMSVLEEDNHIGVVPYDKNLPVITSWDLGIKDSTVVWYWQISGSQVRAIRCVAFTGSSIPDMAQKVNSYGYYFSQHIAPHDIEVRELGNGMSRKRLALNVGIRFDVAPRLSVQDGINAVRTLLPRVWIDREKCKDGIEALKTYRTEYNEVRKIYSNKPLHDWTSDYTDSFRYFAITRHKTELNDNYELDYSAQDEAIY